MKTRLFQDDDQQNSAIVPVILLRSHAGAGLAANYAEVAFAMRCSQAGEDEW